MALSLPDWVLSAHAVAVGFMACGMWFTQVVHYPLMKEIGNHEFRTYESRNIRLTAMILGPLMVVEATLGILLVLDSSFRSWATWTLLALLSLGWASTALLQFPLHRRLAHGFNSTTHALLVQTHWIRTTLWTLRVILVIGFVG